MDFFDTHCHYDGSVSPETFLAPLSRENRWRIMAVGGSPAESRHAEILAQSSSFVWFAAGVHPHNAEEYRVSGGDFRSFAIDPKLKAVGELGLDYYYDNSLRATQHRVFAEFLDLALELKLPAIVHLRDRDGREDAYADGCELLEGFARKGGRFVVHCYSGSVEYARRFLDMGGYIGMTGMVTFRRADNIREVLKVIPLEQLVVETDSPYLAPVPLRGSVNHPANLPLVIDFIAREKSMDMEVVAALTAANGCKLYQLENEA